MGHSGTCLAWYCRTDRGAFSPAHASPPFANRTDGLGNTWRFCHSATCEWHPTGIHWTACLDWCWNAYQPAQCQCAQSPAGDTSKSTKLFPLWSDVICCILLRTAAYCDWHPQDCIVFCNRAIGHLHDLGPRRITHGMYFRICCATSIEGHVGRSVMPLEFFMRPKIYWTLQMPIELRRMCSMMASPGHKCASMHHQPSYRTCKSAELDYDIDIPMMLPPHVRMRRPRPAHDGTETWLLELGQIFSEEAEAETVDGDAYLYIQTWYIDHVKTQNLSTPSAYETGTTICSLDRWFTPWMERCDGSQHFLFHTRH